ncbi:hypothetical protein V2W45_767631 [Cenococcum geophilum]
MTSRDRSWIWAGVALRASRVSLITLSLQNLSCPPERSRGCKSGSLAATPPLSSKSLPRARCKMNGQARTKAVCRDFADFSCHTSACPTGSSQAGHRRPVSSVLAHTDTSETDKAPLAGGLPRCPMGSARRHARAKPPPALTTSDLRLALVQSAQPPFPARSYYWS